MSVTVLVCIKSDSDDLIFIFFIFFLNVSLFKLLYLIYHLICLRLVGVDWQFSALFSLC